MVGPNGVGKTMIGDRREVACREEVVADVLDGALHAPLLVRTVWRARPRLEAVVAGDRGTAPKKRKDSTWPRKKLGIAARSENRKKRNRLYESTITNAHKSRCARPTVSLPKCAQSTCAS